MADERVDAKALNKAASMVYDLVSVKVDSMDSEMEAKRVVE